MLSVKGMDWIVKPIGCFVCGYRRPLCGRDVPLCLHTGKAWQYPESVGHAENDNGFDLFEPYGIIENPPFLRTMPKLSSLFFQLDND